MHTSLRVSIISFLALLACSSSDPSADETPSSSTSDTGEAETDTSSDDTSTDPTSAPGCNAHTDCPGATPLCDAGHCVVCTSVDSSECSDRSETTPICDPANGECVECTSADTSACPRERPVCEAGTCSSCTEHAQCPDSACNLQTGLCMPSERVYWVDDNVPASGDGTEAAPFETVAEALALVPLGGTATINLRTAGVHQESILIEGARTIALLGAPELVGNQAFDGPALVASAGPTVLVADLTLASDDENVVVCTDCALYLQRSRVDGWNNVGLRLAGGEVRIDRSILQDSTQGDIVVDEGTLSLVNSFAGGANNDFPTIRVESGGSVDIVYSSIASGYATPAIVCNGVYALSVRNSMVMSMDTPDEIVCPAATIVDNALEMSLPGNVGLGSFNRYWFLDFSYGDLHLSPIAHPNIGLAGRWQEGDPRIDIDGEPREAIAGQPGYAGADVPN